MEFGNREINLRETREEAERKMKEREQNMKERESYVYERDRLKRADDINFILKQQLHQQQAILEEVQQQNKLLLSLYQKALKRSKG